MTTTPFNFRALVDGLEVTHTVRVVTREGEPWFVATDVCRVLGLSLVGGSTAHLSNHDPNMVARARLDEGPRGGRPNAIISEAGLNLLLMRSDKPAARPFQDWLAREVLPSIRKTGSYSLGAGETMPLPTSFVEALRQHAETLIKLADEKEAHAATEAARKAAQAARAQVEAELERVLPAAEVGESACRRPGKTAPASSKPLIFKRPHLHPRKYPPQDGTQTT